MASGWSPQCLGKSVQVAGVVFFAGQLPFLLPSPAYCDSSEDMVLLACEQLK